MGLACPFAPCTAISATESPFSLGVASGDPWPDGIVIWTRLVRDALAPDGGMGASPIEITWEVARDERMGDIVRSGVTLAMPELAHSGHVEVRGLDPGRWYWYRFRAGRAESPTGRTRTAPAPNTALSHLRFAAAACQHWMYGHWAAYRRMVEEEIDFVLHLGDYIYEAPSSNRAAVRQKVREVPFGIPKTLSDYRRMHALYKSDPAIQAAHAAFPWIAIWDDHEVENDYAAGRSPERTAPATFLQQRAAAYQAYWEHMPLRLAQRPNGPDALLYRRFAFGDLIDLMMLDERQYVLPCPVRRRRPGRIAIASCRSMSAPKPPKPRGQCSGRIRSFGLQTAFRSRLAHAGSCSASNWCSLLFFGSSVRSLVFGRTAGTVMLRHTSESSTALPLAGTGTHWFSVAIFTALSPPMCPLREMIFDLRPSPLTS